MTSLLLPLLSLAFIGSLPRIFFRRGRLHLRWWVTALPFFLAAACLITGLLGWTGPVLQPDSVVGGILRVLAIPLAAGSIALIGYTLGTHQQPISLWHQDDDAPTRLVTHGAYARVRHPFYTAFLLALLGCVAAFPHIGTIATLVWGWVALTWTAVREERRLLASGLGGEYGPYLARTRRFVPRLGVRSRPVGPMRDPAVPAS